MGLDETTDTHLYVISVLFLGLVFLLLVLESFVAGACEGLVVAAVGVDDPRLQVEDVCDNGVEELTVVGHYQDGGRPRLQTQGEHVQTHTNIIRMTTSTNTQ